MGSPTDFSEGNLTDAYLHQWDAAHRPRVLFPFHALRGMERHLSFPQLPMRPLPPVQPETRLQLGSLFRNDGIIPQGHPLYRNFPIRRRLG